MKWTDAEEIAIALAERFPGLDPLTIRFTDLRDRVLALPGQLSLDQYFFNFYQFFIKGLGRGIYGY